MKSFCYVSVALSLLLAAPSLGAPASSPSATPSASASPSATASPPPAGTVSYAGTFIKALAKAPQHGEDWRIQTDRFGRFAVYAPGDWVEGTMPQDSEGMMYALVLGESQPHDGFAANLVVSQTQAPDDYRMTPAMLSELAAQTVEQMKPYHYVLHEKSFTAIDGVPSVIVGGTFENGGRALRNLQLRIALRGVNYLFTLTCPDTAYAQYEPLFAEMVKSAVFEKTPAASP